MIKPAGGKCHSTTSKWWKFKIKIYAYKKKNTGQSVKGRSAKQISVM
jgi:hypothetical protein